MRIGKEAKQSMGYDGTDPNRLVSIADEFDYDRYSRQEFEELRNVFRENTSYVYKMHEEVMELLKPRPGSRTAVDLEGSIETFSVNRQIIEEQFENIEREYDRRQREEEEKEEEERYRRLQREEEEAERREEERRKLYSEN